MPKDLQLVLSNISLYYVMLINICSIKVYASNLTLVLVLTYVRVIPFINMYDGKKSEVCLQHKHTT